jgi:outer membrane protein assembly factor BamD
LLIIQEPYKDALYYKFDSAYQLGINSVPAKMEERLNVAKAAINLVKFNAETKYRESRRNVSSC